MEIKGKRAYELLKKIGFTRLGGSKEELEAANILKEEVEKLGLKVHFEAFEIDHYTEKSVKLEVLDPKLREVEASVYGFSGNTPKEGVEGELKYVENALPANLVDCKDKIVMVNGRVMVEAYEQIVKSGAKGFISFGGSIIDKEKESDLEIRNLRDHHLKHGKVVGVTIRAKEAMRLLKNKTKRVRMFVEQEESKVNSHNVVTTIEGTKYKDEVIAIVAHYDSVHFSKGVYDNGAGSVIIMELLHHFKKNPPLRTLRFVWFGSEEKGLLGAKAYVRDNDLSNFVLAINVDVGGPYLGAERAIVTADNSLVNYLDYTSKVSGFPLAVNQGVYSSDSTMFADSGIPALSFCRFGSEGGAFIHNRHDTMDFISSEALEKTARFVKDFASEMANALVFPVPKKMPQNMVDEVDKYLRKEKKDK